jgi:hypothetical protein
MDIFAVTTIVDHSLSFANHGKQPSNFRFRVLPTNGSLSFPFSVCGIPETERYGDMETSDRKRKYRQFSLFHLPFAYRANGSLSFLYLLMKKKTEVIRL